MAQYYAKSLLKEISEIDLIFGIGDISLIVEALNKEEKVNLVIDPFDQTIGIKMPSIGADILLITHDHYDHNNIKAVKGSPFLITGPGEYEVKGVFVQGIRAAHDKSQGKERGKITIYKIEGEQINLCHLGDLGQKELTSEQLDKIGDVDILMIPVGGVFTISAQEASKIISQIEPKIVIPMHYQTPDLKIKLQPLDNFLKEIGKKGIEPVKNLNISLLNLPEEREVVWLTK